MFIYLLQMFLKVFSNLDRVGIWYLRWHHWPSHIYSTIRPKQVKFTVIIPKNSVPFFVSAWQVGICKCQMGYSVFLWQHWFFNCHLVMQSRIKKTISLCSATNIYLYDLSRCFARIFEGERFYNCVYLGNFFSWTSRLG